MAGQVLQSKLGQSQWGDPSQVGGSNTKLALAASGWMLEVSVLDLVAPDRPPAVYPCA